MNALNGGFHRAKPRLRIVGQWLATSPSSWVASCSGSSWGAAGELRRQRRRQVRCQERGNYSKLGSERVQVAVVGMDFWVVVLAERFPTGYGLWL